MEINIQSVSNGTCNVWTNSLEHPGNRVAISVPVSATLGEVLETLSELRGDIPDDL